jgi:hypothetical protein
VGLIVAAAPVDEREALACALCVERHYLGL